jgi:hypothetical protein
VPLTVSWTLLSRFTSCFHILPLLLLILLLYFFLFLTSLLALRLLRIITSFSFFWKSPSPKGPFHRPLNLFLLRSSLFLSLVHPFPGPVNRKSPD